MSENPETTPAGGSLADRVTKPDESKPTGTKRNHATVADSSSPHDRETRDIPADS